MSTIPSLPITLCSLRIAARWCNAAAGKLLTAAAILGCLNALAIAIEHTHLSGQACGRLLKPRLHHLWTLIDWRDVAAIVITGLLVMAIGSWQLLRWSHRTLVALSEQLGQHASALVLRQSQPDIGAADPQLSPPAITEASATQSTIEPQTPRPYRRRTAVVAAKPARQPQASRTKARALQAPRGFAVSTR